MRKLCLLGAALALVLAVSVSAYPFGAFPQCGPLPSCADGCYIPPSEKCAFWVVGQLDDGASACYVGSSVGACTP